jgi:hypothetical protein
MTDRAERPEETIYRMLSGYRVTQAISVAATLGIADLLAGSVRTSDDLAMEAGVDPDALYRLMRALAGLGLLTEEPDRAFRLTELGAVLRSDAQTSMRGWAEFVGTTDHWQAWGALLLGIQTGENAYQLVHGADSWTLRARHPERAAVFNRAMTSMSGLDNARMLDAFDFGRFSRVVDVGGGHGSFLASILSRHPRVHGVLFDQPHVVAGAGPLLDGAGVADRCEVIGGDMFVSVPPAGNAYILRHILHDWADADCVRILHTCRLATLPGAALLIVERELGGPNDTWESALSDLNMLVGPGGRERTAEEYARLVERAGFRFIGTTSSGASHAVFECLAA